MFAHKSNDIWVNVNHSKYPTILMNKIFVTISPVDFYGGKELNQIDIYDIHLFFGGSILSAISCT